MKTTKELARELGLLRKRTMSSSSACRRGSANGFAAQTFKYLIVIDFESTCWQDAKFRTQEIIEFPAVLLNTVSGEIESEFHYYVQPQEQPTLSAFCNELTGITQEQVDEGIPIGLCLRKFSHWLDKLYRERGVVCQGTVTETNTPVNTTCVTWSDWDLGVCLQYECKRKQLLKPGQLSSWIDLRATYRKFYDRKPNGLNGALQDLGIEFEGREHSGVDDARNTAKLAYRMIKDGCQMKVTKTLKTHERSASCNPTITKYVTVATRQTPPRKAKEKASVSPIIVSRKIQSDHRKTPKIPVSIKTNKSGSKEQGVETSFNVNIVDEDMLENVDTETNITEQSVKTSHSQKRKHFTPVKYISKESVQSPRRKIQRKFSPRKFSPKKFISSDIYIDPESKTNCSNGTNDKANKNINLKQGLSVQDSNIEHSKNNGKTELEKPNILDKGNLDCFKVPTSIKVYKPKHSLVTPKTRVTSGVIKTGFTNTTPLSGSTQSSHSHSRCCISSSPCSCYRSSSGLTPKTSVTSGVVKKGFTTSTPVNGNQMTGFNQSKQISPVNQSTPLNDFSHSAHRSHSNCCLSSIPCSCYQSNSGLRTINTSSFNRSDQSSGFASTSTSMKVTPPLCKCGRRSRRRMVQSPGQNMGRFFFSCTVRKRVGAKEGCDFFKWETSGLTGKSVSAGHSWCTSSNTISKQFTPVMKGKNPQTFVSQKRNLGVRSYSSQKTSIR